MKILSRLLLLALLVAVLGLTGCGSDGSNGAAGLSAFDLAVQNGFSGTLDEWLLQEQGVEPESCGTCHDGTSPRSGDAHQAVYDELFQQDVVVVSNVAYSNDGTNDIVTFDMTKDGVPFDCTLADSVSIVFADYIAVSDTFELGAGGFNYGLKGTLSNVGGTCTSTKAQGAKGDLTANDGVVVVYGFDELVSSDPVAHLNLARYPFAATQVLNAVPYVSAANATGCENCHTTPYYKHGYIIGDESQTGANDFVTCKACHLDDLNGGHEDWQQIVDDPQGWAAGDDPSLVARYAYKKNLMNDVHMSHAMEFPYPQSMANCATCHAGKLTQTLADANFTLETCKSCHPIDGGTDTADANGDFAYDTTGLALSTLLSASGFPHTSQDLDDPTTNCNGCHQVGGIAPAFSTIHTGYNAQIYSDTAGAKYSDTISVSIDTVDFAANLLTINFSATGAAGGLDSVDIIPTLMVGLYGWDSKDFIVGPHERDADRNRLLEIDLDGVETNPRFTVVDTGVPGTWEATADLSMWADLLADGTVKRAEVAVLPLLADADGNEYALNAVSTTFDLVGNAFDPTFYDPIVDVANCNTCHDALATTFHGPERGGSVVVCRMCHITRSGGSHLQGQSRSIDSYVHAIHSFQPFDVDDIDPTDPVEVKHYEEHISFLFPDFATINCEACHEAGAFNVPDQSKSMPGLLSPVDELPGFDFAASPEVVVGPAARACGGCHRAQKLNDGDVGDLASFNAHTKTFGYRVENDADDVTLNSIIDYIMGLFN